MMKHNPENERIKREYFTFLKEAKQHDESSVDAVAKSISRFEVYTKHKNFNAFHYHQAVAFKKYLTQWENPKTAKKLSKATLCSTTRNLRTFFQWLALQKGYKSKIRYSDADYFNLSEKDTRIANAKRERPVPTVDQIKHVIASMPANTVIEKRNRALIAFTLLTGARDSAVASFKVKHIDLIKQCVYQDAREVNTKNSKTFTTYYFPVGDELVQIIEEWANVLVTELNFNNEAPFFPKTLVKNNGGNCFAAVGLLPEHWGDANPIRKIFRNAFEKAGLNYFNPHSFRKTLAQLGEKVCRSPEEFKAWSQNMGHEGVLTTFTSYGAVQTSRQAEIFKNLGNAGSGKLSDSEKLDELLKRLG